jgi:putative Holliday junction resolvase
MVDPATSQRALPNTAQAGLDLARIAALDIGDRRIGVALSDALGYTAQPLLTYNRSPRKGDLRHDVKSLLRLLRKRDCRRIIVGNPLYLSGEVSPSAVKAHRFVEALQAETDLPVSLWDERLSTTEAHELLNEAGHAVIDRKAIVDQVAAVLILKSYMQTRRPAELLPDPSGEMA